MSRRGPASGGPVYIETRGRVYLYILSSFFTRLPVI